METKKSNTSLIVTIVVLVMTLLFGGTLLVLYGMGYLNFDANNVKEEEKNKNDDLKEENNNIIEFQGNGNINDYSENNIKSELEKFLGIWYESKEHSNDQNPNQLTIKNVNNDKILMELYITRTANFDNFEVIINEKNGTFEAIAEIGPSTDKNTPKVSGNVMFFDDSIKITINSSNVLDLKSGVEYTFKYHINNNDISSYKGVWYENEQYSSIKNSNVLNIKKIDNNKVIFDLYLEEIANFKDVVVYLSNHSGNNYDSFKIITNSKTTDGKQGEINCNLELKDNKIKFSISTSNIVNLTSKNYSFTYKK